MIADVLILEDKRLTQCLPMSNPKGNPDSLEPAPSPWVHRPTQTVRVPKVFAEKVLEYARKLDKDSVGIVRKDNSHILGKIIASGFYKGQTVSDALTDTISVLETVSERKIRSYSLRDRQKLESLISALYSLCQSDKQQ